MNLTQFDRLSESHTLLSDVPISHCPACFQEITEEMNKRIHSSRCILCDRKLPIQEKIDFEDEKEKIKLEIEELNFLQENRRELFERTNKRYNDLLNKEQSLIKEIEEISLNYIPKLDKFENYVEEIGKLGEKIDKLKQFEKIQKKFLNIDEEIIEIDKTLEIIESQKNEIIHTKEEDQQKLNHLTKEIEYFLKISKFRNFKKLVLDDKYLPIIDNENYKKFSDSQRVRVIIAYHYGILRYSIKNDTNYPRFLIIDAPNQQDIDVKDLGLIYMTLADLNDDKEKFQLIIAATSIPETLSLLIIRDLKKYLAQPQSTSKKITDFFN
ncbi:hypothetical protein LCGC14_1525870 [marine sediment metagenome]|uniref:Uncharacterized protein n=1 Tax=marine sediment metagenome TaxID=412755 RepID=A0A0F9LCR0_9ZZZZ